MIRATFASLLLAVLLAAFAVAHGLPRRIGVLHGAAAISIGVPQRLSGEFEIIAHARFAPLPARYRIGPREPTTVVQLARRHWVLAIIDGAALLTLMAVAFSAWRASRRLA